MPFLLSFSLALALFLSGCAKLPDSNQERVADVIPVTMANLRGHQALYNEGWFVVTSSRDAFAYAKEKAVIRSGEAIARAQSAIGGHASDYGSDLAGDIKSAGKTGVTLFETGTENSGAILATTHALASAQVDFASENFQAAWERFVRGNLSLAERTADDRAELRDTFGRWFGNMREDFGDLYDIAGEMNGDFGTRIAATWDGAIDEAGAAFHAEYEESGESPNTLIALVDIFQGYAKSLYIGLVRPASKTVADGVVTGTTNTGKALFLPVAAVTSVAGRTVQSVGLTLYYTTKVGVKIVSPTVEAGFLSGLSILSLGAVPVTYVTGASIGAVNQVAMTAAAPVAAAGEGAVTTTLDTTRFVTFVAYDAVKGTTKVLFNQAASGVVLGYNAITALPTHLVMAAGDAAFFLAWDGPNLVVAVAKGRVGGFSAGTLPVGSVVDLKALQGEEGMNVKIVSDDPALIGKIMGKLPDDMRIKGE